MRYTSAINTETGRPSEILVPIYKIKRRHILEDLFILQILVDFQDANMIRQYNSLYLQINF
jgi:hypothetical protein